MITADRLPEVLIMEREASIGERNPTDITIKLSPLLGALLTSRAIAADREPAYIARVLLENWAETEKATAEDIAAHFEISEDGKIVAKKDAPTVKVKKRKSEHDYKRELAASLRALGLLVETEFKTGAGDADIAVFDADRKSVVAIVEVKLALKQWRECHQASGQATAYAKAAGASIWFLVAPELEEKLIGENVLAYQGAAAVIAASVRKAA